MIFSRSYILLCLARGKSDKIKNVILQNACIANFKLQSYFASSVSADGTINKDLENCHLSKSLLGETGYARRLKNELQNNNNNVQKSTKHDHVTLLEKDTYEIDDTLEDTKEKLPGPLDPCDEDLSHIGPNVTPTYNFAKVADQSYTLQQLVKLGVQLYKLESDRELFEMYLKLDFEKDMKPYIRFLHDCGISPENLGNFINKNPKIFKEDMDDLYTRIRYLRAHEFTPSMIKTIINTNPIWLSFKTQEIDRRLGHFQSTFRLTGFKVRSLAIKCPKLITYDMKHIRENTFAVREEMGFDKDETQLVLLSAPRIWIHARSKVVNAFDYAHNEIKLSHRIISQQPQILLCRKNRLQQRHQFLVELKRDQYDPLKPLYVSPLALVSGSDVEFCVNVAKASIYTYNMFLKNF